MYIITGGAGFIGSNIVLELNARGECDILVVDNLTDGKRFNNLFGCHISDYQDKNNFLDNIINNSLDAASIQAVFHQGACSSTTEWDGRYMMENNYQYSKTLLHFCQQHNIPFIYASSAAVYGGETDFREDSQVSWPLNVYGYSKYLFDQYVANLGSQLTTQVVGLRYFNVYGPRESHKDRMASMAFHLHHQIINEGVAHLFGASKHSKPGEQSRDFVAVEDIAKVNCWFLDHPQHSGVFNVGTGISRQFNQLAQVIIDYHQRGSIEYIPFPDDLINSYQEYTQADLSALRNVGCDITFKTLEQAIPGYLDWLKSETHTSI
ncbi:MAG: ADP-glyceromanno-heptose 6-epimerase [Methylococcales bacterium]